MDDAAPPQQFDDPFATLPEELVDACLSQLALTLDGPADLVHTGRTCSYFRALISSPAFAARRGAERGRTDLTTISQLAIHEGLQNVGSRLVFLGASVNLRPGSSARLGDFAQLLRRHQNLVVSIEAHTGRNAPAEFAPAFTHVRGRCVSHALMMCGIDQNRIAYRGWGKEIAVAAEWQPGIESARAELFFREAGSDLEFPPRPSYYAGREPPRLEDRLQQYGLVDDDEYDDAAATDESEEESIDDQSAMASESDQSEEESEGVDAEDEIVIDADDDDDNDDDEPGAAYA